jgi:hypothetical protein
MSALLINLPRETLIREHKLDDVKKIYHVSSDINVEVRVTGPSLSGEMGSKGKGRGRT